MSQPLIDINDVMNIPAEEAFRVLGTNIKFNHVDNTTKLIAVTSYAPKEGKTVTAVHLAITLSKSGSKVLLVDADLRKPIKFKKISQKHPVGIWNLKESQAQEIIHETTAANLYITTSGQCNSNPMEIITSNQFRDFLTFVRENFDYAIFDTSSIGSYVDGAVIASKMDGSVIVAKANQTRSKNLIALRNQMKKVNANVLGVVLNSVKKADFKNYYLLDRGFANTQKGFKLWGRK